MTGAHGGSGSIVDAVTDEVIAALLPAGRRMSMTFAEHRDRAHVDSAVDRLLRRGRGSEAERARV